MSALEELLGILPADNPLDGLPVEHLSPSSIDAFWKCAEQWRRERIDRDPRPATDKTIFGRAFHRAVERNFLQKIDSHEDLPVPVMRDMTGDAFNTVLDEEKGVREINWYDSKPDQIQSGVITAMVGTDALPGFHQVLAPTVQPVAVERWLEVKTASGVPLSMRVDVEDVRRRILDVKTTTKRKTQADLDKSTQATAYLYGREREGNPATEFGVQVAVRTLKPQQQELVTTRSAGQLEAFERLVDVTVATVRHFLGVYGEAGPWPGASPLGYWCSPTQCSFYASCVWRGGS
ncbi:MAG: PD-(D/E)XK nuclease family protein [Gemmatimonadaceae bacterium]|nr:PD-(D/E)XK nuclease family protein [Gemmatimonadaceae bacterium]